MRLTCIHLTTQVVDALRPIAAETKHVVYALDDFAALPQTITSDDRFAIPIGDIVSLVRALEERRAPIGIDVIAVMSPGVAPHRSTTSADGVSITYVSEDELLGLPSV